MQTYLDNLKLLLRSELRAAVSMRLKLQTDAYQCLQKYLIPTGRRKKQTKKHKTCVELGLHQGEIKGLSEKILSCKGQSHPHYSVLFMFIPYFNAVHR